MQDCVVWPQTQASMTSDFERPLTHAEQRGVVYKQLELDARLAICGVGQAVKEDIWTLSRFLTSLGNGVTH